MSGNTAESGFTPRRLVIVGCRGRMGTLLSARWSAAGHTVAGLDLPLTDEAFAEALPGADAVFLCIPAGAMAEVLPHLVPHLDGRQILADITSVKMQPLGQMERAYAGPVVGTHPLFGPKPQPSDLRVCITPGAAATDTHIGLVEGLFKDMGCSTFRSTAEAHDSAAAAMPIITGLQLRIIKVTTIARPKIILMYSIFFLLVAKPEQHQTHRPA